MQDLTVLLLVLLIGSLPLWPHSLGWGYRPASLLAVALGLSLLARWFRLISLAGS
jgi:hypothetical protein